MSKLLSRRNFLKGTAAGTLGVAATTLLGGISLAEEKGIYTPGTYSATANGMGKVKVTMSFDANSITDVQLDLSNETPSIGQAAQEQLRTLLMNAQTSEIDAVSGVTVTTNAVKEAAATCIAQAKGESIEVAATAPAAAEDWLGEAPVIDEADIVDEVEADIVVMGGGNSGVMCAFAAVENGASVAVIESQAKDSIFYYGLHDVASINSKFALAKGAPEINKTEFLGEFQRRSHNRTNPRLVKKFVDNSGEMMDWLLAHCPQDVVDSVVIHNLGANQDYIAMGSEVNRFTCWTGTVQVNFNAAASTLVAEAESKGAKWYWEHTGIVLEKEEGTTTERAEQVDETGKVTFYDKEVPQTKVTAVIAKNKAGEYIRFKARKAVVLAGGGYGGNPAMYAALQDEKRWLYKSHGLDTGNMRCAVFGRDGSGIKMAMWAGATMDPGPRTLVDPQVMFQSDSYATNVLRWGAGFKGTANPWGCPFVWLDSDGRRFTDETFMGVFGVRQQVERRKPGRYYAIFDSHWEELMSRMPPEHFSLPVGAEGDIDLKATFESWVERGALGAEQEPGSTVCAWGANTLEELVDYMGFDEEHKKTILAEIARYNTFCANGEDEDYARDPKMLLPVNQGPFFGMYCVEEKPMTGTCTLNGVVIDENQRVLDVNYNPIENLYATGNNSGGRFAIEYSTPLQGLTLGMAMTLGRELGKELTQG